MAVLLSSLLVLVLLARIPLNSDTVVVEEADVVIVMLRTLAISKGCVGSWISKGAGGATTGGVVNEGGGLRPLEVVAAASGLLRLFLFGGTAFE